MATKKLTERYKLHLARQMIESISELSNTAYYVFASDHIPREVSEIPVIDDDLDSTLFSPYSNMQFGKRVGANDSVLVVRNIPYVSNTVYAMYDDTDEDLIDKDFYVVVNASSYYHVFKCLDNNFEVPSTVEPNFAHITGSNTEVYQTSDGYRWKYICTASANENLKFGTDAFFPYIANSTVSSSAVAGAIDVIKVDGTGGGYHNYLEGSFSAAGIRVSGDPLLYRLSNSTIQQTNGFYTGCILYLSTGTGAGQYATITDYFTNGNGSFAYISSEFATTPVNGTTWQVNPAVIIKGNGRNIVNAVARALVNASASNSIYRVEMLNRGSGYDYATANVIANSVVDVLLPAELRVIRSPYGGHGYDGAVDLNANAVMFSVKFSNSETNTITTSNKFQQIGVLKDPVFSEVDFVISSSNGTFLPSEKIYKIDPIRIATNGTVTTTSSEVTVAAADFTNQLAAGDFVYLKSSNGTSHMITTVHDVVNSSVINISSNCFFACTETLVYLGNVSSNAVFSSQPNSTVISVTSVSGVFTTSDIIVGNSSGGHAVISSVKRNGVTKDFNTFVQMNKLVGTLSSGSFVENEIIYQGSSLASANVTAVVHSSNVDGGVLTIYTTNQTGPFAVGEVIGANSLSVASISTVYKPEIIEGSGEIIFLENISPVQRQGNQSEIVQINFSF